MDKVKRNWTILYSEYEGMQKKSFIEFSQNHQVWRKFMNYSHSLKDNFNLLDSKVRYYSNVEILLIDDIGAEKVTDWGRDEILGTILQSRMNNHLTTFFTSNLTIEELEKHLSISKDSEDVVKARRVIERIKQLTIDEELVTENRRN